MHFSTNSFYIYFFNFFLPSYPLPTVPSAAPRDIECSGGTDSLTLAWKAPPLRHQNGVLRGYRLVLTHIDDRNGTQGRRGMQEHTADW